MIYKEDSIKCPYCKSLKKYKYGFSILIKERNNKGFPKNVEQKQKYKCKKCGHVWREK